MPRPGFGSRPTKAPTLKLQRKLHCDFCRCNSTTHTNHKRVPRTAQRRVFSKSELQTCDLNPRGSHPGFIAKTETESFIRGREIAPVPSTFEVVSSTLDFGEDCSIFVGPVLPLAIFQTPKP